MKVVVMPKTVEDFRALLREHGGIYLAVGSFGEINRIRRLRVRRGKGFEARWLSLAHKPISTKRITPKRLNDAVSEGLKDGFLGFTKDGSEPCWMPWKGRRSTNLNLGEMVGYDDHLRRVFAWKPDKRGARWRILKVKRASK